MYLQTRCQDYFTAMSCFCFSHTTTIWITEKKIFFQHIKIFLSNLLLYSKELAQLCFFTNWLVLVNYRAELAEARTYFLLVSTATITAQFLTRHKAITYRINVLNSPRKSEEY